MKEHNLMNANNYTQNTQQVTLVLGGPLYNPTISKQQVIIIIIIFTIIIIIVIHDADIILTLPWITLQGYFTDLIVI